MGAARVLHVSRQFSPATGGLETYVSELAKRQSGAYEVTVLTLDRVWGDKTRLPRVERGNGYSIVRVPFVGGRRLFLPLLHPRMLKGSDIVHVHSTDQLLDSIALARLFETGALFVTTHGMYFHTKDLAWFKQVYLSNITRRSLARAHKVFAVSENDAAILHSVNVQALTLRNPIVPLGEFLCEGHDLLYVGRISSNKRVGKLVDFFKHVSASDPRPVLHIVGSDSEGLWPQIAGQVAEAGLSGRVRYHGYLSPAALAAVTRTCGFTVTASQYEGFGMTVLEGMSVGLLPCMQVNEAFRETYSLSGCGLLTDFADPAKAALEFLAWRATVTRKDRESAVDYARAQSWDAVCKVYDEHYQNALTRRT